jgi:hypothetical protein
MVETVLTLVVGLALAIGGSYYGERSRRNDRGHHKRGSAE